MAGGFGFGFDIALDRGILVLTIDNLGAAATDNGDSESVENESKLDVDGLLEQEVDRCDLTVELSGLPLVWKLLDS